MRQRLFWGKGLVLEPVCPRIDGWFPLETPWKESAWPAGVSSHAKTPWTFLNSATSLLLIFAYPDLRPRFCVFSGPVLPIVCSKIKCFHFKERWTLRMSWLENQTKLKNPSPSSGCLWFGNTEAVAPTVSRSVVFSGWSSTAAPRAVDPGWDMLMDLEPDLVGKQGWCVVLASGGWPSRWQVAVPGNKTGARS